MRVVVVGAGIFGVTTALAARSRGDDVTVVDPGPVPHVDAASTDLSKLIRMDYGTDALYTDLMERAWGRWHRWNAGWHRPLFHPSGMLVLCPELSPGTFEGDSFGLLRGRGVTLARRRGPSMGEHHPAWRDLQDGYLNPRAGWAESGAVVAQLWTQALGAGVRHVAEEVEGFVGASVVEGVTTRTQQTIPADVVVVATGARVADLLPELRDLVRPVGQPVLHFRPPDPSAWRAPQFPAWAADISNTGWYGFPANRDGIIKVANHGPGVRVHPADPRTVPASWEPRFRDFFRRHLPGMAGAELVGARLCLYADSVDGDFWIDRVPGRDGVVVAGGGSGHGFKFAPVLGGLVLEAIDGRTKPRFAWRAPTATRTEEARWDG